jgi:tetratricopeptide (TPR) repeat protein
VHHLTHEDAGRWIAANLPPDAVVAAHDVGALAFYSKRRIVDIVGVVLPEVVDHLNTDGYLGYLDGLFEREGVTHLAVLRTWFIVDNALPVYVAVAGPEPLEIYERGASMHIMPPAAVGWLLAGTKALNSGAVVGAESLARRSLAIDQRSGRAWQLLGSALEAQGRSDAAAEAYARALELFPGLEATRERLERLHERRGVSEAGDAQESGETAPPH